MQPPGSSTGSSYNRNYSPSRSVTTAAGSSSSLFPSASSTNNAGTPATLSAAAALQGATHAFHRQRTGGGGGTIGGGGRTERDGNLKVNHGNGRVNPNQTGTGKGMGTGTGKEISHGALLAATQAVSAVTTSTSASRSRPQSALGSRPGSVGGMHGGEPDGLVAQRMAQYLHASGSAANAGAKAFLSPPQSLLPVSPAQGADGRGSMEPLNGGPMQTSASFIAATLAASRSASPTPSSSVAQQSASSTGRGAANSSPSMNAAGASTCSSLDLGTARLYVNVPDTASIWPTTSLVSLFEGKRDVDPVKGAAGQARPRTPEMERERTTQGEQQQKLRVKPKPKPKPKSKGLVGPSSTTNTGKQNETWTEVSGDRMGGAGPALRAPTHVDNQHSQRAPPRVAERSSETTQPSLAKPSSKTISPVATEPTKIARPERAHPSLEASGVADMTMPIVNTAAAQHDITPVGTQERTQTPRRLSQSSASSDDTFVSASSVQSGRPVQSGTESDQRTPRATEQRRQSSPHAILLPATHRPTMSRASTPNLPLDSLTDAIVASNLASTRQTTTSSASFQAPPPIPAPRRHGGKNSHRGKHTSGSRSALPTIPLQPNRTAESLRSQLTDGSRSPNRAQHPQATQHQQQRTGVLLQTLRATQPVHSDDEDARRRASQHHHHRRRRKVKASLGGGRKHAHHEGARRRWRDEVTPRERRRYEAVWASNKGLFLKPGWGYTSDHTGEDDGRAWDGPEAELVVNIVVRDIWRRSRLPADELAEVWDLVYCHHQRRRHAGGGGGDGGDLLAGKERERKALTRDEFVVGMWLIDQRLRGRKIPARVGQSVWESVR